MRVYVRVLRAAGPETYSTEEEQQLRDCVTSAPGVEQVARIEKHVKGGYAVTLEQSGETLDDFSAWLTSAGYCLVV
jgi:hypothetical protein